MTTEQDLRIDLAACYRLVALFGWDDLVFVDVRLPLAPGIPLMYRTTASGRPGIVGTKPTLVQPP